MRRLAAAALPGLLLCSAGCSTDRSDTAGPAPKTAVSGAAVSGAGATPGAGGPASGGPATGDPATSGDVALSGNTGAICEQAARTGQNFAATFAQDLKLQIDASTSADRAQVAKAQEKTSRDVENYSFALTDMSRLVDDPTVKGALAAMGKQVRSLKGDVRELDDGKLSELGATLDKACGKS